LTGSKTLVLAAGGGWTGGDIFIDNGTTFRVNPGQTLSNNADTTFWWGTSQGGTFDILGTFRKNGGNLTQFRNGVVYNLASTGTLDIQAGALQIEGNTTYSGTVTLGTNNTLRLAAGTHTFDAGSTLNLSAGIVSLHVSAIATSDAAFSPNSLLLFDNSTLTLNATTNAPSQLHIEGSSTLNGTGNITVGSGGLQWFGGTLGGSGTLTVNGPAEFAGGGTKILTGTRTLELASSALWAEGDIFIDNGTMFRLNPGQTLTNTTTADASLWWATAAGGTFDFQGTLRKTTGTSTTFFRDGNTFDVTGMVDVQSGTIRIVDAANLVNFSAGTLTKGTWRVQNASLDFDTRAIATIGANAAVILDGATSTFNALDTLTANNGTLRILGGKTFTPTAASINNAGTLEVGFGSTFGKSVVVQSGGTLLGEGAVSGAVTAQSGGTLAPGASPGILTINGDLALQAGSFLAVELNGATPGTQYDQLVVNGTVDLTDAVLNGILGYSPSPTDRLFILVNDGADPITGTFNGLPDNSTVFLGSHFATISYDGDSVSGMVDDAGNDVVLHNFQPVPEPLGNLALAALGLGAIAWCRRSSRCRSAARRRDPRSTGAHPDCDSPPYRRCIPTGSMR
jgi:hypothetical protein